MSSAAGGIVSLLGGRGGGVFSAPSQISAEVGRQQRNEQTIDQARALSGQIAANPFLDFDSFAFEGADPRQEELDRLLNIFKQRSQEVQQARFSPGLSQTRLALVE